METAPPFAAKAARSSWRLAVAAAVLAAAAARLPPRPRAACELAALACAAAGIGCGAAALCGIRRRGSSGILFPAIAGLAANGLLAAIFASNYAVSRPGSLRDADRIVRNEVAQVNAQLPRMLSPDVRLDEIAVSDAKEVRFRITLTKIARGGMDIDGFVAKQTAILREKYGTGQSGARFRRLGSRMAFSYFDRDGDPIATITVGGPGPGAMQASVRGGDR